jgi:4-diphosphocytidyl-2-C-methyl-D-erythritol kinase
VSGSPPTFPVELVAPAKLNLSLAVTGRRADGLHELRSEMVSVSLADRLVVTGGDGPARVEFVAVDDAVDVVHLDATDNTVGRAMSLLGLGGVVRVAKVIPPGAGLGGGSSDAAALLRWRDVTDPQVALEIGSDVPFCVGGGRALVCGAGEVVESRAHVAATFTVLIAPFGVATAAVYRAYDDGARGAGGDSRNELAAAARRVEPRVATLVDWLAGEVGRPPHLSGSGSTTFYEGVVGGLGHGAVLSSPVGPVRVRVLDAVPAGWVG